MDSSLSSEYGISAGVALAGTLAQSGRYVFTTEDALGLAPKGVGARRVSYLLKALADAGWLLRLRRDLYAGTGSLPGGVDIPAFAIATSLVSPSAISHWSALAYHDLTDQVPVVVTAMTPKKVVTPGMRKGGEGSDRRIWHAAGIDCRYVTVVPSHFSFGVHDIWLDEHFRVPITDKERTVLDLFALPRLFGGLWEGFAVLERARDELDLDRLVDYALSYGAVAVAKRLGWSLEETGFDEAPLVPLLRLPASHYSPLDPGQPRRGEHDRRWMIIANVYPEPVRG